MGLIMKEYVKKIKISKKLILKFRSITKDNNPIHSNIRIANQHGYKKPIVYGLLSASFLSSIIGNDVPGPGSVWLDTNIQFINPVYENDQITIISKVIKISEGSSLINLESVAKNQYDEQVFSSISTIKASKSFIIKNSEKKIDKLKLTKKNKKIRSILIIGASSKIIEELLKKTINKYERFIFIYHRNKPKMRNKKFKFFKYDFKKTNNSVSLKNYLNKNNCKIDAVISSASEKLFFKDFFEVKREEIVSHINIQTVGIYEIFKSVKDLLFESKPSIVLIGSEVLSSKPPRKMLSYTIGKFALLGFFKALSEELGPEGIRVNMISPGIVDELSNSFPEISKEMFKVNSSLGTLVKVNDIVNIINFLISKKSKNITGQNIRANSGYSFN